MEKVFPQKAFSQAHTHALTLTQTNVWFGKLYAKISHCHGNRNNKQNLISKQKKEENKRDFAGFLRRAIYFHPQIYLLVDLLSKVLYL